MKISVRNTTLLSLILSALCASGSAFGGKFVLECSLNADAKYILSMPYSYNPLAMGHNSPYSTKNNHWTVRFTSAKLRGKKIDVPGRLDFTLRSSAACHELGMIDGIPIVNRSYLQSDGTWFKSPASNPKLHLSPTHAEQTPEMRRRLEELKLSPPYDFALIVPRNGRLVYEIPLISFKESPDGKVAAVYQSISADDGLTWTDPVITTGAEIYELGKSQNAQSFAARQAPSQAPARH